MTVHALKSPKVASLRSKVSPEEWQARVDLAAAYRLVDLYGMSDLIANHISMRVPGEPDHFLINNYGETFDEVTASSLVKMDMDGNVWQWTDEFTDEHTRAAILRGGSYYQPQGSIWYFPQAYHLNEHGKLLLMSPSMDRSGAVGFRCVRDAK